MILQELSILNFKNIQEASLQFAPKINCFIGLNGQGKTNLLDAIYYLSFTKSAFTAIDSQNIRHGEAFAMVQGTYRHHSETVETYSLGLRKGLKKQFRKGKKDYQRLIDHIGQIPLVMVCPQDHELIEEGSDARRRFMDGVISQQSRSYLDALTQYNALIKQRNALLKQYEEHPEALPADLMEILEDQLYPLATTIYEARTAFIEQFVPVFQRIYKEISDDAEQVSLGYVSQLQNRDLRESYRQTRQRDLILGWTSQGIHKDELDMKLGEYALKQVASQGQQKTFLLAMKLAQAVYLATEHRCPILLLDDIFDKLDSERVARIVALVQQPDFGQIFITDTDRQHLTDLLGHQPDARVFHVQGGEVRR